MSKTFFSVYLVATRGPLTWQRVNSSRHGRFSQEAFAAQKAAAERAKAAELQREKAEQQARRKAKLAELAQPRVQRKIFHVFAFEGNGDTFRYKPPSDPGFGLNTGQVRFDSSRPVTLTTKSAHRCLHGRLLTPDPECYFPYHVPRMRV